MRDVTPDKPVLLRGQFHMRISESVHDPLTVTALAMESGDEQCVMVSVDHVVVPDSLRDGVREKVSSLASGLDPNKVFIGATHTHTAPQMLEPSSGDVFIGWEDPGPEVMPPQEYGRRLVDRVAECVVEAWENRRPGAVAWGMGYAVVGRNRRQVRRDGSALMYGDTSSEDFSHIEGYEDHSVQLLFTYDEAGALTGMVVNVPCPAQVTESHCFVSADYWHEVRRGLRERYGDSVFVLPQCAAAGDLSPHLMFDKEAELRMLRLRGFLEAAGGDVRLAERMEIARRVVGAVDDVFSAAGGDMHYSPKLRHSVRTIRLPRRRITESDVERARAGIAACRKRMESLRERPVTDPERSSCYGRLTWYENLLKRYEMQDSEPTCPMELHVVRVGDVVFATNAFEIFVDYGIRIRARSRAVQTFVVQLVGPGGYLPTVRATAGGSYGSEPESSVVGPEGGDVLVEETLKDIDRLLAEGT